MSFYSRNLQLNGGGSGGDRCPGLGATEELGCRLTKYLVLLQDDDYPTRPHYLEGQENPGFHRDVGDGCRELQNEPGNVAEPTTKVTARPRLRLENENKVPIESDTNVAADINSNTAISAASARDEKANDIRVTEQPGRETDSESGSGECPACQHTSHAQRLSSGSSSICNPDDRYDDWRLPLDQFTSKRLGEKRKSSGFSKELRSYYKSQDTLIGQFEELRTDDGTAAIESQHDIANVRRKAALFAKITFAANLVLLAIKVVAVVMSGSISLISSLVDSSVDLLSGVVIWLSTRAVRKTDRYVYPQGRTKLEPVSIVILSVIMSVASLQIIKESVDKMLGLSSGSDQPPTMDWVTIGIASVTVGRTKLEPVSIVILSVIMSVASLQIIKESVDKMLGLSSGSDQPPTMDWVTIGIASVTVVLKLVLFLMCYRVRHPTIQALAQDHRNDVLSNGIAILFGYIGSQQMQDKTSVSQLVYLDPAGAMGISIYIIVMWCITGWDQIKLLVGHTATPEFLSKITWICMDHHKAIEKVDTVRAFHFGNHFLVEADIVLPPDMTLREAHDIGQPLQQKLERLPTVERAFVHIDYEAVHDPKTEHKVV